MKNGMKVVAAIFGVVLVGGTLAGCKHYGSHGYHGKMLKEHI